MTTKPIDLLIDMDGVVADYYGHFLSLWRKAHPDQISIEPHDLEHFYIEEQYGKDNISKIFHITQNGTFFEDIPPVVGAVEALGEILADKRFNAHLCTAPELDFEAQGCWTQKARWVDSKLGRDWLKRLIITKDKTKVQGDYLIDDKPKVEGSNSTPTWKQVFFEHRYNRDLPGLRLKTWADWPALRDQLLSNS